MTAPQLPTVLELAEVWCRACPEPATGPDALCDGHRSDAVRQLGVCGWPRWEVSIDDLARQDFRTGDPLTGLPTPQRCACGLAVSFASGEWFHTFAEATFPSTPAERGRCTCPEIGRHIQGCPLTDPKGAPHV